MRETSTLFLTAFGTSMKPLLKPGKKIQINLINNYSELSRGDVVLYLENGQFYIHRIWNIKNNKCLISDDGYVSNPYYLDLESIFGKVILPFFGNGIPGLLFSFISRLYYRIKFQFSKIKNFGKHRL